MDSANIITILVAVLATVISLVSLQRTRVFNERQLKFLAENEKLIQLQRKLIEREELEKTASDISVFVYNAARGQRLCIVNSGKVIVENVSLEYIEQDGYENPFIESELSEKLPIKRMHPNEEHTVILALHDQTPMSFEIKMVWKTNDDCLHEKHITVTP
jgi:hypothetical protein